MTKINYELLKQLAEKPHPLLNIANDFEAQIQSIPAAWIGEIFTQARTAHHLLDLAGIPQQVAGHYSSDLDARVWQLAVTRQGLQERLDRIATWHARETADGGMVGDYCVECGEVWPCETRRMADGSHEDLADTAPNPSAHVPLECVNVRCSEGRWCGGCDPDGSEPCSSNPWPCKQAVRTTGSMAGEPQ